MTDGATGRASAFDPPADDAAALDVRGLSKVYRLYDRRIHRLFESLHPLRRNYHRDFYALRDVSFSVARGETFGIIGRNGSGKSTLLKILAGVLTASDGQVRVRGRVSALLELGTGFNPLLTGIENCRFAGALMGYSGAEMDEKLRAIEAFADIGEYIRQPVRSYSSGMFARLAFAVAISAEPDVLIVDEALSVGDEAFQRKCFARIEQIQQRGGTILFVSHSAAAVTHLCSRAILLDRGELLLAGEARPVVARYHRLIYAPPESLQATRDEIRREGIVADEPPADASPQPADDWFDPHMKPLSTVRYESRGAELASPRITTLSGEPVNLLTSGQEYLLSFDMHIRRELRRSRWGFTIKSLTGVELGGITSHPEGHGVDRLEPGTVVRAQFRFRCLLAEGTYFASVGVVRWEQCTQEWAHRLDDALMFRVSPTVPREFSGTVDFRPPSGPPCASWTIEEDAP